MGKVIAIISGKDGTGKTTTVAAISCCLAALGYRTLCVDLDAESSNLELSLGLTDNAITDFTEVLSGKCPVTEACREHYSIPNLFFISVPSTLDAEEQEKADLAPIIDDIRNRFDYCLIDGPAGIGLFDSVAHEVVDLAIIVESCDSPAVAGVLNAVDAIHSMGILEILLIVNRVRGNDIKRLRAIIDDEVNKAKIQLVGVIPEDKVVSRAIHESLPLVHYRKRFSVYEFLSVARRITGEDVPLRIRARWRTLSSRSLLYRKPRAVAGHDLPSDDQKMKPAEEAKRYCNDADSNFPEEDVLQAQHDSARIFQDFFGDPEQWARSTLSVSSNENLVKILTVKQHQYAARESVRNRMWLHEILDNNNIPYYIEIEGYWPSRRKFAEMQNIYIEEKHQKEARRLIITYNNPANFTYKDLGVEVSTTGNTIAGVPQRICQSCGKEIDFDYQKCPFCKEHSDKTAKL